ncbi:MAG: site-specific integrase, partial [Burkholderia sp.]|nr:site-specific integrase [Burkholderia sp.]
MTDDPVAAYLSNLKHVRQLSEHTLRAYTHELDELKKLAAGRPLDTLTAADMRGAVARAHAGGLSARSISHRLSAWRAFYRWLAQRVEMPANPVAAVRAPKRPKTLPKALSVDDASALMDAPVAGTTESIRDHAILELFYSSGLRLAEL